MSSDTEETDTDESEPKETETEETNAEETEPKETNDDDAEADADETEADADETEENVDETEGEEGVDEDLPILLDEMSDRLVALKRAIVEGEDEVDILELADDLWEVIDAMEDVLRTIDFEEIPEAIDFEELPEAVDVEDIPEGFVDEDETVVDLGALREAVNMRKLWQAVDLLELREEKQELDDELDDLTDDDDGDEDVDEDEEDDDLVDMEMDNVVDMGDGAHVQFNAEARQAALEEKINSAVGKFRSALLATHRGLRAIYETNQEKLGQPGNQPQSRNPTAASTMPGGPVPDSASTRTSTVPARVKYSRVNPHRRIYGRRFDEETEGTNDRSETTADESEEADATGETADTDVSTGADDPDDATETDDASESAEVEAEVTENS